jgi:hypothetical protein
MVLTTIHDNNNRVFNIDKRYAPVKALGRGSSGVVVAAVNAAGQKVAVKKNPLYLKIGNERTMLK